MHQVVMRQHKYVRQKHQWAVPPDAPGREEEKGVGGGGGGRGWREGRVKKQLGQKQQMQRRSYAWKDLYFGITQRLY